VAQPQKKVKIMGSKIIPGEYSITIPSNFTLNQLKQVVDKRMAVFQLPLESSEIWESGILAVKSSGTYLNRKIKLEFFAKIKENQVVMKLNNNLNLKLFLEVLEPRMIPVNDSDCAVFLQFWDTIMQDLGLEGRIDIGKPILWETNISSNQTPINTSPNPNLEPQKHQISSTNLSSSAKSPNQISNSLISPSTNPSPSHSSPQSTHPLPIQESLTKRKEQAQVLSDIDIVQQIASEPVPSGWSRMNIIVKHILYGSQWAMRDMFGHSERVEEWVKITEVGNGVVEIVNHLVNIYTTNDEITGIEFLKQIE
jgi:hypothetical protein